MRLALTLGYSGARMTLDMELVREVEQLGYDSIWSAESYGSDAVTPVAWIAALTTRVHVGTGIMQMAGRTPAATAMTAMTLDGLSGGRFRLGLGTGHRATMGGWHGQDIGNPVAEMREYVALVRALLAGGEPPAGLRWNSSFAFNGFKPRADIPIYLAGLSPAMLRLA